MDERRFNRILRVGLLTAFLWGAFVGVLGKIVPVGGVPAHGSSNWIEVR